MARDVTLRATYDELVGDETYELWLKHESDAWALEDSGDVVPTGDPDHQDFVLSTLETGDDYVAQIRTKRSGRYRSGYLSANPDSWPGSSRAEFTPGALEGVDAPVINSATWSRTGSSTTQVALDIDAADLAIDIKVFRDAIEIGTITAPHAGPGLAFVDASPTLGTSHTYTAAHASGYLDGPLSDPVDCFVGPLAPTDFARTSADDSFGKYSVTWDADGDTVQFQDDFLCDTIYVTEYTGTATPHERTIEVAEIPDHGVQAIAIHARVRKSVTSFTVTDVSDWVQINIICDVYDDNPDYHSCP